MPKQGSGRCRDRGARKRWCPLLNAFSKFCARTPSCRTHSSPASPSGSTSLRFPSRRIIWSSNSLASDVRCAKRRRCVVQQSRVLQRHATAAPAVFHHLLHATGGQMVRVQGVSAVRPRSGTLDSNAGRTTGRLSPPGSGRAARRCCAHGEDVGSSGFSFSALLASVNAWLVLGAFA